MGFLDKLRTPRLFNFNLPDPKDDDINNAFDEVLSRARATPMPFGNNNISRGGGRMGPMRGGADASGATRSAAGIWFPNDANTPKNVVYDQRPEQFAKEMALKKEALNVERDKAAALTALNSRKVDVQQQNADTNEAKANAIMARQDLTDSEKMVLMHQNQMEMENTRQGGRMALEGARGENRMNITNANNAARSERQKVSGEQGLAKIAAQTEGRKEVNAFKPRSASDASEAVRLEGRKILAEHPEWGNLLSFDEKGNPVVNPGAPKPGYLNGVVGVGDTDDAIRRQITERLYGPKKVPISEQPGHGDIKGNASLVDMVDPNGRPLRVPANEVEGLLKKGARRK